MKSIRSLNLLLIFGLLLSVACDSIHENNEGKLPSFPQPKSTEIQLQKPLILNPVTGDSIQPILNSLGEEVKTGVSIPVSIEGFPADSISPIKKFEADISTVEKLNNNVKSAGKPEIIEIDNEKVLLTNQGVIFTNFQGDSVLTGVPIVLEGNEKKVKQPKSSLLLAPRQRDVVTRNIQYIGLDQGLSDVVYQSYQDSQGYIWFATPYGVGKYDGRSYLNYTQSHGLSSSFVRCMLEDRHGNMWFGLFDGGIIKYDGTRFINFSIENGLGGNNIWAVIEDVKGNFWFGTDEAGAIMYNGESFTHFTTNEGLRSDHVYTLLEDSKGNIWFGTDDGLTCYDGKCLINYYTNDSSNVMNVLSLNEDKEGNIWIGTYNSGVFKFDSGKFENYTAKENFDLRLVRSIETDKNGDLWFGSRGGGVCKYDGNDFYYFDEKVGLSHHVVESIMVDELNNIWISTVGGGVNRLVVDSFEHLSRSDGMPHDNVIAVKQDERGDIWFGTYGGGISSFNGQTFTQITFDHGDEMGFNDVSSIVEDDEGSIWYGTQGGGICKLEGDSIVRYSTENGLLSNLILDAFKDNKGDLWFATYGGGVTRFDGESFYNLTDTNGLSSNFVWSITQDHQGNMWFGSFGGGVSKFDGKSIVNYTEKEGLSSNTILYISVDHAGDLWMAAHKGGACRFDGKKFWYYTEREGLPTNFVWSLIEDENQDVWVGTDGGLARIVRDKNSESSAFMRIESYGKYEGLKGMAFNAAVCKDKGNKIWWGTNEGLTTLDLGRVNLVDLSPKIDLDRIEINGQFVDFFTEKGNNETPFDYDDVPGFKNYPVNLTLPYDHNYLTFFMSALDWSSLNSTMYSYQMEGLDKEWSVPSFDRKAEYRNLPYGEYTFKIKAIGRTKKWSETFEYNFTILPPWYHTWWARTMYAVILISLIWSVFTMRVRALKKRQLFLEREVKEATHEIRVQKEKIEEAHTRLENTFEQLEESHKEITDSINYAERIQRSFLATKEILDENLKDYFVFFKPKEAVSGDFYWAAELNNGNFAWTCADSTGHGVPGAIMSLLNISSLEKSIETETSPEKILDKTREIIVDRLKKDGSEEGGKDGMDCNLLVMDKERSKLIFASAHNPVVIVRGEELIEFKGDKIPVGKHDRDSEPFTLQTFQLQKGDVIYALTDGFPDQFGGPKGKKYMIKNLKKKFVEIAGLSMGEQKSILEKEFEQWKQNNEQIDDVCVIGVRV